MNGRIKSTRLLQRRQVVPFTVTTLVLLMEVRLTHLYSYKNWEQNEYIPSKNVKRNCK